MRRPAVKRRSEVASALPSLSPMDFLPEERRLPDALRLPEGALSATDLGNGVLPDDAWCRHLATELSPDLLIVVDPLLRAVWASGVVERILGIPRGELLGSPVSDHVHPDDLMVAMGALNETQRADGYHVATRIRVRRWDGTYVDTRVTAATISDDAGTWMVLSLRPVEDEVAIERRRAQLKALAQSVYVECAGMRWFELSNRIEGMLGALAGVVGARTVELAANRDGAFVLDAMWARSGSGVGSTRSEVHFEPVADLTQLRMAPCVVTTVDQHPAGPEVDPPEDPSGMVVELWLDGDGGVVRLVFGGYTETWDDANADIIALSCSTMLATMHRCEQERELNTRATRDPLTRLLNRSALLQRLEEMLAVAGADSRPVVLFADLNHFKALNDRFGHREGDRVLCRVADAIASQVRAGDVAARIGGDEFVVVFEPTAIPADHLVERIRSEVDAALAEWPDVSVAVGAIVVEAADSADVVIDRADQAMYADKARNRNAVRRR